MDISIFEAVRRRPGMYVGWTNLFGLHVMLDYILDMAVDEALSERCDHIWITLSPNHEVSVRDNRPGISVEPLHDLNISPFEGFLNPEYRSAKFLPECRYYCGLNHNRIPWASNALCAEMTAETTWGGSVWRIRYREGVQLGALEQVRALAPDEANYVMITFQPDFTILEEHEYDCEKLKQRCRELAYTVAGLHMTLRDERISPPYEETFFAADGLRSMVVWLNEGQRPLHEVIHVKKPITVTDVSRKESAAEVECAYQFTLGKETHILGYANTLATISGVHMTALKGAILSTINGQIERFDYRYPRTKPLDWSELAPGLSAVVAIRHPEPRFENAIRPICDMPDLYGPVAGLVYGSANFELVERLLNRCLKRRKVLLHKTRRFITQGIE